MTVDVGPLLVLHGGALGDFVLSLPTIEHVKARHECPSTTIVARGQHGKLARQLALAQEGFDLETAGLHPLFTGENDPSLPRHLTKWLGRFAAIIHFFGPPGSPISVRLSQLTDAHVHAIDPPTSWHGARHAAAAQLAQVGAAEDALKLTPNLPRVRVCERLLGRVTARLSLDRDRSTVVLHPGSGSARKCWPMERFVHLARLLRARNVRVLFALGPVERESWSAAVIEELTAAVDLLPELDLGEFAAVLHAVDVFVGNDSGPAHLAALVRTATLALFGPTDPDTWRPLGDRVVTLAGGGGGPDSRGGTTVEDAARTVMTLLSDRPAAV